MLIVGNKLKAYKVGRNLIRVKEKDLDEFLEQRKTKGKIPIQEIRRKISDKAGYLNNQQGG